MLAVDNFQGVNAGIFVLRVAVGIVMIAHGYHQTTSPRPALYETTIGRSPSE